MRNEKNGIRGIRLSWRSTSWDENLWTSLFLAAFATGAALAIAAIILEDDTVISHRFTALAVFYVLLLLLRSPRRRYHTETEE